MQCSKEAIARLFYNASASFQLFMLFSYLSFILLVTILHFLGGDLFYGRAAYDEFIDTYSDDEEKVVEDEVEYDEFITYHGTPVSVSARQHHHIQNHHLQHSRSFQDCHNDDDGDDDDDVAPKEEGDDEVVEEIKSVVNEEPPCSIWTSSSPSAMETNVTSHGEVADDEENIPSRDNHIGYSKTSVHRLDMSRENNKARIDNFPKEMMRKEKRVEANGMIQPVEEKLLHAPPPKVESKRLHFREEEKHEEDIFGDSCTVGSTSKSSSEWRSSIKDSCTEDPFSSSSRRSCPKWESYTLFQKYDEEMLFLDRISAQKLRETESLRIRLQSNNPRSVTDRIVHKFRRRKRGPLDPYNDLEAAYVAQICLTWEALNWNYKQLQRLLDLRRRRPANEPEDRGCPAYVAQQFQQFQVLLQRYIENEPFEHGRRPEVYARVRGSSPKLLQVPEYRDSDEEKREEGFCSRIPSDSFLQIMEESIRTFMNFLKADKEGHYCQMIASFFKKSKSRPGSADPLLLLNLQKVNKKKKRKLKDMKRTGKLRLRKIKLKQKDEMEILMAQIDLKVVCRVLRMKEVNGDQLHWCKEKMNKVKIKEDNGMLQRDSSPLFFPSH
ncbi:unnamed protein product [Cuscuta epithymum]|uniref:Ribosomal protein L34Ae n=1 Tax=Cuscuta epithymum TaxID=186058 RepID=A0AAV0GGT3_9ASTE|nr:unnamed protein product [Cuscuta epithymum]